MKRAMVAAAVFVFVLTGAARAQDSADAQDAARRAMAEELLSLMDVQGNMEKSFDMVKQMLSSQLKQEGAPGDVSSANRQTEINKMMDVIMEEMSWDKMKDDYISIYSETFTEEELAGIVTFYKSPVGMKFIEKQPELMERSMKISQKQMAELMPKIQKLVQEMKEKITAPVPVPAAQTPGK